MQKGILACSCRRSDAILWKGIDKAGAVAMSVVSLRGFSLRRDASNGERAGEAAPSVFYFPANTFRIFHQKNPLHVDRLIVFSVYYKGIIAMRGRFIF